jgi:hypothetical protein
MLIEIQNNLIDLRLVSDITNLIISDESKPNMAYKYKKCSFQILVLNSPNPIEIKSKEFLYMSNYDLNNIINPEKKEQYQKQNNIVLKEFEETKEKFEALHIKLVNFWKIAKKQTNIIKLD